MDNKYDEILYQAKAELKEERKESETNDLESCLEDIQFDEEKSEEILAKYDREFAFRRIKGPINKFVFILATVWSLVQLYTAAFGTFSFHITKSPHVGAALILVYLLYPARKSVKSNKIPLV